MNEPIVAASAPAALGAYPHARRVGQLLFLSGLGPRDPQTGQVPGLQLDNAGNVVDYDFETQCHCVFRNIRAVLEAAGSSWSDLVDVTVFLTDMKRDFAAMNRIYTSYFQEHQPCRTTIEVGALPTPIAIELKCIAALKS